jgi:hypothetical protein
MPATYPMWNDSTPATDWGAEAKRFRNVKNSPVIEVLEGTYRGCAPMAGFFELVNPDTEPRMLWGSMRAEVYCAWHGVKPFTVFPQVVVGKKYKIYRNYSGKVTDNIA